MPEYLHLWYSSHRVYIYHYGRIVLCIVFSILFLFGDTESGFAQRRRKKIPSRKPPEVVSIKNEYLEITCNKKTGVVSFLTSLLKFWDVTASVLINRDQLISLIDEGKREIKSSSNTLTIEFESTVKLVWKVELPAGMPYAFISLSLENSTSNPITIEKLIPFKSNGNHTFGRNLALLKNYYYSWGLSSVIFNNKPDFPLVNYLDSFQPIQRYSIQGNYLSDMVMAIRESDGSQQITLGFTSHKDMLNHIRLWNDRVIIATCEGDGITLEPGATIKAEELYLDVEKGLAPLERYAKITAQRMNVQLSKPLSLGWYSWYQYFEKINEEVLLGNLAFLSSHKKEFPVDFFQIGDGYQLDNRTSGRPGLGDWLVSNNNFPHGMQWIADTVRHAGFKPALWIAPFLVGESSDFYKNHPECVIHDAEDNPISVLPPWRGDQVYALDCTHPASQEWLRKLFTTIIDQWGFEYVNIDFLFAAARAGNHYKKNATRAQAYRMGLEVIRNTVGTSHFIIAGGAPLGPSIGLVDAMRIGPDVSPGRWEDSYGRTGAPSMMNAIRNTIGRYYMHNTFWLNHPDCIMLRDTEIELSDDEIRAWLTLVGLTNGLIVISDNMSLISAERQSEFHKFYPYYSEKAIPLDFWESEYPTQFDLKINSQFENYHVVGLFNWNEEDKTITFDLNKIGLSPDKEYHIFESWERKYLGKVRDNIEIEDIPPHGCKLLIIKEVQNKPQLISTGIHFTEGGVEVKNLEVNKNEVRIQLISSILTETKALFAVPGTIDLIERTVPIGREFKITF